MQTEISFRPVTHSIPRICGAEYGSVFYHLRLCLCICICFCIFICICLYSLRSLRAARLPWSPHCMARICGAEYGWRQRILSVCQHCSLCVSSHDHEPLSCKCYTQECSTHFEDKSLLVVLVIHQVCFLEIL